MSVISITENTRDLASVAENDELDYVSKLTRKFNVIFDEFGEAIERPILAYIVESVSGSEARIPRLWDAHPYDPWAYVMRKTCNNIGGYHWEVVCEYERVEEPLETPFRLSYSHAYSHEQIDKDADGAPITNSALETSDPPLMEECPELVMRFEDNWSREDPRINKLAEYINTVNSDYFFGGRYAPGTCLCRCVEASEARLAGLWYYMMVIEIHVRPDGWQKRFLDEGFRVVVKDSAGNPEKDDDGNLKFRTLTDSEGNPLTAPVMLDGTGSRLADGAAPVYITKKTKKEKPFYIFNFNPERMRK
jgi:hypothetical protein